MIRLNPALWLILVCTACSQGTSEFGEYSRVQAGAVDWDVAFVAAKQTIAEYFRIDSADLRRGVIQTAPTSIEWTQEQPTMPLPRSASRQTRRLARLRLKKLSSSAILAECSVIVQENREAEHRALAQQSTINETPGRTPLEESEGFDDSPQRYWTTVRHDTKLEREILAALMERLGPRDNP